jgi:2-dehydro-3-deoxyphosphooctonate aldolase (KDO 8-P synthase)
VAAVVDVLQTPAFLCRQTDFIHAVRGLRQAGEHQEGPVPGPGRHEERRRQGPRANGGADTIMVCERGASFGYNNLVSDMRSLAIMRETGCPVVFDATHSVQLPGGQGTVLRRSARVRAGAGAGRRGGRHRRPVHGDPP